MPIIEIHISEQAEDILQSVSASTGRTVEDLAECAVEEACLNVKRQENSNQTNLDLKPGQSLRK
jgi:hypothetical protein